MSEAEGDAWLWDEFTAPTCVKFCEDATGERFLIGGDRRGNVTVRTACGLGSVRYPPSTLAP